MPLVLLTRDTNDRIDRLLAAENGRHADPGEGMSRDALLDLALDAFEQARELETGEVPFLGTITDRMWSERYRIARAAPVLEAVE